MLQSKLNATLISMTLAFTLLISALAATYVMPTRALPPTIMTWYVPQGPDPFWGYYGGYHAVWDELAVEFAKLGIALDIDLKSDQYAIWEIMWSPSVPEGGQVSGSSGWDVIMMEWWLQPQGMLWNDGIILGKNLINGELAGYNPFPYLSKASDEFYWGMQTTFDANTRKAYADAWQKELQHNPPMVNIWHPHIYSVQGAYFKGYNDYSWTNDVRNVSIDRVKAQAMFDAGNLTETARARLLDNKIINYAANEGWWNFLPPFVDSYTEEEFQALVWSTLYRVTVDPWPADGVPVDPNDYTTMPWLASSSPVFNDTLTDYDGETVYRYVIPLREGIKWTDGHILDAEDIVWTYNDIVLDADIGATSAGDFAPIVKRAEYIGNYTPASSSYNATALRLVLYEPYVDLELILANDWGLAIVPYHYFGGVPPELLDPENKNMESGPGGNGAKNVPSLGPFKYKAEGSPPSYSTVELEKNDLWFGYNVSIVGNGVTFDPGWGGPYNVDGWIFEYIIDAGQRLINIETHASDYSEYPTAPIETFENFMGDPNFISYIDFYPAANPIWFNFNNPNITNRYVRLAVAHAVPYAEIYKDILPSWGIKNPVPGGTGIIHPWQYYEGIQLFNTELQLYTYDLEVAQAYLNMSIYAQTGTDYTLGCPGDANFDGIVDLDDRWLWGEEFGNEPYTRTLDNALDQTWLDPDWYSTYPWPTDAGPQSVGSVAPGNDVDADFNNNGVTGAEDYAIWLAAVGNEYPFPGAF